MKKSIVYRLQDLFSSNMGRSRNITRDKCCRSWATFWECLILAGIHFEKTDLKLLRDMERDRYSAQFHSPDESHYSLAVRCGNLSFAYAYEFMVDRVPFIGRGISYRDCWPGFTNHATIEKTHGRLVFGCWFDWLGYRVKVTSFKDACHSLIACSYKKDVLNIGISNDKIIKRFTITFEEFRKAMRKD